MELRLRDAASGLTFQAEPGSPAEVQASPCVVTDNNKLIAPGSIQPHKLPLGPTDGAEAPLSSDRVLTLQLVPNSALLGLLDSLEAPLEAIMLRFSNIVLETSGSDATDADTSRLELRAAVDGLDAPPLYEIACSLEGEELKCSPWPLVDRVFEAQASSPLSLVLQTPLNAEGKLVLALDQHVEFFENIQVEDWSPQGTLLETIDRFVSITGQGFTNSMALECLFFAANNEELQLIMVQTAEY